MRSRHEAEWPLHLGVHFSNNSTVNYSAYTSVATPQHIDQMIYFKAFVQFFYLNHYCELDYFFCISSNASLANYKT